MRRWWITLLFATCIGCRDRAPAPPPQTSTPAVAEPKQEHTAPEAKTKPKGYDLAADHARRIADAEKDLGGKPRLDVVDDVYMVFGPPGLPAASFERSAAFVKKTLAALMNDRFDKRPDRAMSIYLFPSKGPYEAFCLETWGEACISVYGFYAYDGRRMVMNIGLGIGTLSHELVHPIVAADFPGAPTWIDEGIASVFEAPTFGPDKDEIHGVKNWRHPRVIKALASKEERALARIDRLFGMPDKTFRGTHESLNYAVARYVCQWLDSKKMLWPFYRKWRDGVAKDPTGVDTFTNVVGKSPAAAQQEWESWVKTL